MAASRVVRRPCRAPSASCRRVKNVNVKQAANVLELLEFFATHQRPASLAEIAKQLGWPRSSTFNLLNTLTSRGYLYEPRARQGYYPAPAWASLLNRIEQAQPMPADMPAFLAGLVEATGETAVLAAASGGHALFIETMESPNAVRYAAPVGKRVPLHVTATGRALLSQMADDERATFLKKATYERYTSTTLMSAQAVQAEIDASLARGWFQGHAEYTQDLGGVAVPVALGERRFAVLVAGPSFRIAHRLPALAQILGERLADYLRDHRPSA